MTRPPLYLVTGGCRSGKSAFAQSLAESIASDRVFIATAGACDPSMAERIERHRAGRDSSWRTLELAPGSFSRRMRHASLNGKELLSMTQWGQAMKGVLLFDCLTLFLAGEMEAGLDDASLPHYIELLFQNLFSFAVPVVMVTNEVGLGGISASASGRKFCDLAGTANQRVAAMAQAVALTVSGIPLVIKGSLPGGDAG